MDAALPLYVHVHFSATCRKQQNECCLIFLMQWLQKGIFFELICTWSENSRISSYDIYHSYKCFELPSSKFSTAVGCHRKEIEISYQYAIRLKTLLIGLLYLFLQWVTMTSILCPPVQDSCHGYDSYISMLYLQQIRSFQVKAAPFSKKWYRDIWRYIVEVHNGIYSYRD